MNPKRMKICILGGGFGGLYTALDLSRHPAVRSGLWEITLVEPKDHFLFTPLLYELITGELQPGEIAPSYRQLLAGTKIRFKQEKVKIVDFDRRQVTLENSEFLAYDYLVLAVGRQNRWLNISGLSHQALTFRSLADVDRLQSAIHELEISEKSAIKIAIVGGGPNGVELACKLADRLGQRGQLHLIERGQEILKSFPKGAQVASYRSLLARKVILHLDTELEAVTEEAIAIRQDQRSQTLAIDLLIWTAGTQARDWITQLSCQQNAQGQLLTHPTLQLLDYPEVFALGDVAEISQSPGSIPATAQAAYQAASRLAKNLAAVINHKPLKPYRYLHLGDMMTLGKNRALVSSFGINITGGMADVIRKFVYILRLPTKRHQLKVLKNWLKKLLFQLRNGGRRRSRQLSPPKSLAPKNLP